MLPRLVKPGAGSLRKFYFSREPRSTRHGPQAAAEATGSAGKTPPQPETGFPKYSIDLADV
jgi:hypothetical protein